RDRLLPPRRLPEAFTDTSWMQKPEPEPAIMTEKWRSPYDAGFWWQQSGQQNTTTQIQARLNQQSETSSIPLEEKDSPLNKVPAPPIEEEGKVASRSHSEISGGGNNVPPPPSLSAPEPEDEPGDQGIPEDVLHLLSSGKSSSQATTSKRAKPPKGFLIASPQSAGGLPDDDAFLPPVSLQDKQADIASWIEKGRPGHAQWKTPSSEQLGVYQSQAQNIAVKGGAGAGKTSTIMNKLAHLATRGQIPQRNMHLFSYMHSGVDVLNAGRQDINALLPEHNPDYQIPEAMTYFALGHKILTKGSELHEQTKKRSYPILERMGVHWSGHTIHDVSKEDKERLTSEQLAEMSQPKDYLRQALYPHMRDWQEPRLSDTQIKTFLEAIEQIKSNRTDDPHGPYISSLA